MYPQDRFDETGVFIEIFDGVNRIARTPFADFFVPSGLLAQRLEGYEYRPQQFEFAQAVHEFLRDPEKSVMAAEAPPGVGKTFAGLIPSLLEAEAEDCHVLFLTASIALQEQLI